MAMPKVNPEVLQSLIKDFTPEEKEIINIVVKKNGEIRATKPKIDEENPTTGKAAYVWRKVVFMVSKKPAHNCMPITADFDLPAVDETTGKWSYKDAMEMSKKLKGLEDAIIHSIPVDKWHGVNRWGRALGY